MRDNSQSPLFAQNLAPRAPRRTQTTTTHTQRAPLYPTKARTCLIQEERSLRHRGPASPPHHSHKALQDLSHHVEDDMTKPPQKLQPAARPRRVLLASPRGWCAGVGTVKRSV